MIIKRASEPKEFKPVELKITFESLDEVRVFWAYMNMPHSTVIEYNPYAGIVEALSDRVKECKVAYKLFCTADDILKENTE